MSATVRAGVAASNITPPVGVNMAGFASRDHGAEGVHDELRAKALVIDIGDEPVCLITNDLIGFGREAAAELRAAVEETCAIPPDRVMINGSHTHSGPALSRRSQVHQPHEAYLDYLHAKVVGTVKMAADAREPVTLAYGREPVQVGINRRECVDGEVRLGRNPEGPVAPYVDVVRVTGEAGEILAILFAHAAHPVVMGGDSYQISADFPGAAQALIERVYPGALALFAQGCCGDINADPRDSFEVVGRLGRLLGAATIKAAEEAEPLEIDVLDSAWQPFELPLDDPPPLEQAEAELAEQKRLLDEAQAVDDESGARRQEGQVKWAQRVVDAAREGRTGLSMTFDLHALRLGELAIIGLPGEVFVDYQLNLEAASPFERTIVLGYTNGVECYVPTAAAIPEGGYEVVASMRYYGATQVSPTAEEALLTAGKELLARLA